jgi:hypothetical protein
MKTMAKAKKQVKSIQSGERRRNATTILAAGSSIKLL